MLGASQGMGLAIAEALAAEGANVAMFARRADVVEREAARIGALAVPGDLTAGGRPRTPRDDDRRGVRRDRHPRAQRRRPSARAPPRTSPPASVTAAVELLLVPHVRLVGLCLPHLRASGRGRIVAIESTSVKEPIANLALSNAVRPGVVGLAEDAVPRARAGRDHRQHDRAGPDRHRAAPRALRRRRPAARAAGPDPGAPRRHRRPRSPRPSASSRRSRPPTSPARSCRSTAAC